MVGRQIASCNLPSGCPYPLLPEPPYSDVTKVTRKAIATQSSSHYGLLFPTQIFVKQPPFCGSEKSEIVSWSSWPLELGVSAPGDYVECSGTSYEEVIWNVTSNTVVANNNGIYKRPGTNVVLITNLTCRLRRYTFTGTLNSHMEDVGSANEVWRTTQNAFGCGYGGSSCNPADYDITVTNQPKLVTDYSSSGGSIYYDYLPVVVGDVIGISITPQTAGWKVAVVGGVIQISNATGTLYTFSGTLTSVVSAINATSGGTLFTATIPSTVNGTVALVSDLKSFSTDFNQAISCAIGIPLLHSGDLISPSGVSSSPIYDLRFSAIPPCYAEAAPKVFGQEEIDAGFEDSPEGYNRWLRSTWYAKLSTDRFNPPPDDVFTIFTSSRTLFNAMESYPAVGYSPGIGCTYSYLKDGWSLTPGNSTKSFSYTTVQNPDPDFRIYETTSTRSSAGTCSCGCSDCSFYSVIPSNLTCFPLTTTCDGIPSYKGYCQQDISTSVEIPTRTFSCTVTYGGYWTVQ